MATEIAQTRSHRRWHPAPYDEMRRAFRWEVPRRYNIAADVLDKHEPSRPAMYWEDSEGNERTLTFGDMQALTNRTANALRAYGVGEGDRVAVMLPPLPEAAAAFLATYKLGGVLLSLSILYGDDSIVHRLRDCSAKVIVTDAANRERIDRVRDGLPGAGARSRRRRGVRPRRRAGLRPLRDARHSGRPGGSDLLHVRHDRAREGNRARAPVPDRAQRIRARARRARRRGLPLDRRMGLDRGHRPGHPRAVALRCADRGLRPQGRLRPRADALRAREVQGQEPVRDADRAAGDGRARRDLGSLSRHLAQACLRRRGAAQPGGDQLVHTPVRDPGDGLLRPLGELSAVRQLPDDGDPPGLDGQADTRLASRLARRRRAAGTTRRDRGDLPFARAPTLTTRSATGIAPRTRGATSAATGSTRATSPARTTTATSGTRGATTTSSSPPDTGSAPSRSSRRSSLIQRSSRRPRSPPPTICAATS